MPAVNSKKAGKQVTDIGNSTLSSVRKDLLPLFEECLERKDTTNFPDPVELKRTATKKKRESKGLSSGR